MLASLSVPSCAADNRAILSFSHANDIFLGTDRHYTAGSEISWLSGADTNVVGLDDFAAKLPFVAPDAKIRTRIGIRQLLFTPEDIGAVNPPLDDRPYVGLLEGELALTAETDTRLDQWSLRLGVTGEASGGRIVQEIVHDITGSTDPQGWGFQVPTEPTIALSYSRIWRQRLARVSDTISVDWLPRAGGTLGTSFLNAEAGAVFRIGNDLHGNFGYATTDQAIGAHTAFAAPEDGWGWSVYVGASGRLQGQNIGLDGGVFRDSRTVDRRVAQADFVAGFALAHGGFQATFQHLTRSEEFVGQDGVDQFWTLQLSFKL